MKLMGVPVVVMCDKCRHETGIDVFGDFFLVSKDIPLVDTRLSCEECKRLNAEL